MPGGGPWVVGAGQPTDDTEMAMCLMWGLVKSCENENPLDFDKIAVEYARWLKSKPFNLG